MKSIGMSAVLAAGAMVVAACSPGQSADAAWAQCRNEGNAHPAQLQINGCTAAIASGRLSKEDLPRAYTFRIAAYQANKNYDLGPSDRELVIADLNDAIRLDPENDQLLVERGRQYLAAGDTDRALGAAESLVRRNPSIEGALQLRADAYYASGAYAQARADYLELAKQNPKDIFVLEMLCQSRAAGGWELEDALVNCNDAMQIATSDRVLESRGLVHLRLGNFQAAVKDYDAALKTTENRPAARYGRGIAKLRLGQTADGLTDIEAATTSDSQVAALFSNWGVQLSGPSGSAPATRPTPMQASTPTGAQRGQQACAVADQALTNINREKKRVEDGLEKAVQQMASVPGAGVDQAFRVTCPMVRGLEALWQGWQNAATGLPEITACYGQERTDTEVSELRHVKGVLEGLQGKCTN